MDLGVSRITHVWQDSDGLLRVMAGVPSEDREPLADGMPSLVPEGRTPSEITDHPASRSDTMVEVIDPDTGSGLASDARSHTLPAKVRPTRFLASAICAGALVGCAADSVMDEVGCELTADLVVTLGSLDDSLSIVSGQLAQVVPMAGGWAALDRGGGVLRYDEGGRLLGRLGKEGDGPEELRRPMSISKGPGDSVWVTDSQGRWVIFAPDGNPARTVSGGNRPIDGFTPSGRPFKLYAAGLLQPDGSVHASLYVRRWSESDTTGAGPADRIGPGTAALDRGARTGPAAAGSLVAPVSDTTFLVVGNWGPDGRPTDVMPGEAGVMRWTLSSSELWASSRALSTAVRRFGLPPEPYMIPRGIEADADGDGYWLVAAVRRVSEGEMAESEEELGGASWQSDPSFKNHVFDGVFWHLDEAGVLTGAGLVDEYPEGMAGPGHFFSIAEDAATGLRTIEVYRMPRPCEAPRS